WRLFGHIVTDVADHARIRILVFGAHKPNAGGGANLEQQALLRSLNGEQARCGTGVLQGEGTGAGELVWSSEAAHCAVADDAAQGGLGGWLIKGSLSGEPSQRAKAAREKIRIASEECAGIV